MLAQLRRRPEEAEDELSRVWWSSCLVEPSFALIEPYPPSHSAFVHEARGKVHDDGGEVMLAMLVRLRPCRTRHSRGRASAHEGIRFTLSLNVL